MSVLIKGMEMPKMPKTLEQGEAVPFIEVRIFADGSAITPKAKAPYYTEYEVIELPPHGRLIDADALPWDNQGLMLTDPDEWGLKAWDIEHAPTIIPAEEVQDD